MIHWVLDCWVLASCNNCDCDDYLNCVSLLCKIKERDGICLDYSGEIFGEYTNHINPGTFVSKWWTVIVRTKGKIHSCCGRLTSRHTTNLINMNFDNDDIKYVGTAFNSPDRKLVAAESDYTIEILNYLRDICGIEVLHPCKCY